MYGCSVINEQVINWHNRTDSDVRFRRAGRQRSNLDVVECSRICRVRISCLHIRVYSCLFSSCLLNVDESDPRWRCRRRTGSRWRWRRGVAGSIDVGFIRVCSIRDALDLFAIAVFCVSRFLFRCFRSLFEISAYFLRPRTGPLSSCFARSTLAFDLFELDFGKRMRKCTRRLSELFSLFPQHRRSPIGLPQTGTRPIPLCSFYSWRFNANVYRRQSLTNWRAGYTRVVFFFVVLLRDSSSGSILMILWFVEQSQQRPDFVSTQSNSES